MLHGTIEAVAPKICEGGFSTVATLDDGFFGKGMYFTNSLDYALFYATPQKGPIPENLVVVLTLVVPGNVYPVTEAHKADGNQFGKPCVTGYQSHLAWGRLTLFL